MKEFDVITADYGIMGVAVKAATLVDKLPWSAGPPRGIPSESDL